MMDEETIRWLRDEARDEGDVVVVRACGRALEGDAVAIATLEETLANRVARAHRAHRRLGHATSSPEADRTETSGSNRIGETESVSLSLDAWPSPTL